MSNVWIQGITILISLPVDFDVDNLINFEDGMSELPNIREWGGPYINGILHMQFEIDPHKDFEKQRANCISLVENLAKKHDVFWEETNE